MKFEDLGITVSLPEIMLFKGQGFFAALGSVLTIVLGLLVLIWVAYSIYAGFKIVTSSMAKGLEEGVDIIKNIWVGLSMGLLFFAAISVMGAIFGVGDITRWHTNLSQCNNATGGFYFKDVQEQIALGLPETGNAVYCCLVSDIENAADTYKNVSFKDGTYHYIVTTGGTPGTGFTKCEVFK